MKRRHAAVLSFALLVLPSSTSAQDMNARVDALADRYVAAYFAAFPHNATFYGVADADHDRLPDISPAALARWQRFEDSTFAALEAIDPATLGSSAAVTHGFLG